jgi:predicted transcriptional regulator
MTSCLLTPAEVLAHFRRKDRHSLQALVRRGLVQRINTGGEGKGARWLYLLTEPEPEVTDFDLRKAEIMKEHGL